jgi:lipid-binding SYLF domain-containing protein
MCSNQGGTIQATDFVLLVMNPQGAGSILTSKVKLGGDVAAAAGPKRP